MSNRSGRQKWYAIASGIGAPCIVDSWEECYRRVNGVTGNKFMGFYDKKEAKAWLKNPKYKNEYKTKRKRKINLQTEADMGRIACTEDTFILHPNLRTVYMYTDGACKGNPGPGGWACILKYNGHEKVLSGGEPDTTNNRMEIEAVLQGLMALKEDCNLIITTDSKYVIDTIEKGWAKNWKRHMWKKSDGSDAANSDLWDDMLCMLEPHNYKFEWVKGHNDHPENERCDKLAVAESNKF